LASLSLSLSPVAFIVTVVETDQVEAGKQKPPDPGYLSTHRTIESTGLVVTSESYPIEVHEIFSGGLDAYLEGQKLNPNPS
jgi:hypothetical protein